MLAQNFRTAAELGLSDQEHCALIKVLGMLDRQEISRRLLQMEHVGDPGCGTPGCLLGWARAVTKDYDLFSGIWDLTDGYSRIHELFAFAGIDPLAFKGRRSAITPAQAAIALRNYLTTGEPRWKEAVAE
jgi:hypothetical protein